ncbi:MAG: hypothetical protein KKB20_24195, partial [Proteobacteria bacterium]|nr:hypothetical protein [Pseudomonadota bacterium]
TGSPGRRQGVLVLVNPISGRGRGAQAVEPLIRAFRGQGLEARVELLPGPDAARDLVERLAGPYGAVVAVGGDGTINDVAAALLEAGGGRPLGLIPLGLSNCLARHLGLPWDMNRAAAVIAAGRTVRLDAGRVGRRVVVSFLGAGLDGAVVDRVARARKGGIRDRDYVKAAAVVLLGRRPGQMHVIVDGIPVQGRFYQVILSQVTNYAHYFPLPQEPGFRAYMFAGTGRAALPRTLLKSGPARRIGRAADVVRTIRREIEIHADEGPAFFQIDGEAGGRLPAICRVEPGAIEVFAP